MFAFVAVKYGIWLHWKRCIVCVWGRQKVFHNCLWQATGHRPWSFGRLDFHCFKCQAYGGFFSLTRLKTFEVDKNNCCKEKKFWACPLKRTKFTILTMSRHYTEEQYQIAALFHCWGSFQVCRFARIAISHSLAQLHRGNASRRNITRSTTLAPYNVFVGQKCEILAQCKSHHRGNVASQYLLIMLHFANYLHLYWGSNACKIYCIAELHFCWTVNDKLGTFLSWRPTPCSHGASHNVLSASVWNCEKPKCLLCAKLCPPPPPTPS